MQEKIMEALKNQGFRLEKEGEMGYCFEYEALGLLYLPNENDDTFLNLAVPNIWEADGEQVTEAYAVVNQINVSLKYVKAYMLGCRMWLVYERELLDNEDLEEIVAHMVVRLALATGAAHKAVREHFGEPDGGTADRDSENAAREAPGDVEDNDDNNEE